MNQEQTALRQRDFNAPWRAPQPQCQCGLCAVQIFDNAGNPVGWGNESALPVMREAPAMLAQLRELVRSNYGQPSGVTVPALDPARAILARIDGKA